VCVVCGDGVIEGDEACDDGNLDNGDGCDARCVPEPISIVRSHEAHDGQGVAGQRIDYDFVVDHSPSQVSLTTRGCVESGADTVLILHAVDPDGALGAVVATDDDGGEGACSRIAVDLDAGRYVVRVQGPGQVPGALGPYTLDYRLTVDASAGGAFDGRYASEGDDRFDFAVPERSDFVCGDKASCLATTGCRLLGGETGQYLHCSNASNWVAAGNFCAAQGGQLATIDSAAENDALVALGAWGWIGLNDRANEGQFRWADGSAFQAGLYSGFSGDSSNAGSVDCVVMRRVGGWLHRDCDTAYDFLCEPRPTLQTRIVLETGDGAGACPADTDTVLTLSRVEADGTRTPVAADDNGGVGACSRLEPLLDAGDYEAVVEGADARGSAPYVLTVTAPGLCGNGRLDLGERCDDGNLDPGDGCDATCAIEVSTCGNGVVEFDESCDDGDRDPGDGCDADCQLEIVCGDGVIMAPEDCEDGNVQPGDGCDATCRFETACLEDFRDDAFVAAWTTGGDAGWAVDAGRAVSGAIADDQTSSLALTIETPDGGGVRFAYAVSVERGFDFLRFFVDDEEVGAWSGEVVGEAYFPLVAGTHLLEWRYTRDDSLGAGADRAAIDDVAIHGALDCPFSVCGNGRFDQGEECEDGNRLRGDGCDRRCLQENVCADGVVGYVEECDDGNRVDGDGCSATCRAEVAARRPNVLICGASDRDPASFIEPWDDVVLIEDCTPDDDTQVMLVTRDGVDRIDPEWALYLRRGGRIITEAGSSVPVFDAVFGEQAVAGAEAGACRANINPVVRHDPESAFWRAHQFEPQQDPATSGCG
ncbi:MAG: DUF4215 domain-containing protein, partial [Microthrixaceae bacterium]|nr:DUF4215 domain-containing protein [Microthrixaceae bacterium]